MIGKYFYMIAIELDMMIIPYSYILLFLFTQSISDLNIKMLMQ